MITGIVIALSDEINSLTRQKVGKGDCIFINDSLLLCHSGAGPINARKASQKLIDQGAERLISWGCAAALSAALKPGELILPETLISEDLEHISLLSPWLTATNKTLSTLLPHSGPLIESSRIVAASLDKKRLHQHSAAIALDMESIAITKAAHAHNIPSIVIRCIADPVNMSLPKAIAYSMNEQGDVKSSKLLWFLLTHPSELPGLIKLGLHFNAAKNKLKLVQKQLDIIVGFEQNSEPK